MPAPLALPKLFFFLMHPNPKEAQIPWCNLLFDRDTKKTGGIKKNLMYFNSCQRMLLFRVLQKGKKKTAE